MTSKIVLFGATGYTGRLVARSLVRSGARPVLAGRSPDRLVSLADELGGLETLVADAQQPDGSVRGALEPGDVLLTTVGPFLRYGEPALHAAVNAGAHYVDSTGEPPFIRRVFEEFGPRAQDRSVLLPALGYDFVPGNLAGALAVDEAGAAAVRVDIGYFIGSGSEEGPAMSRGTAASVAGVLLERGFAWREGHLKEVRSADRVRSFPVDGSELDAISIGGSEHLSLPRVFPQLVEVNVQLGWFGPYSRMMQKASVLTDLAGRIPGSRALAKKAGGLFAQVLGTDSPEEHGGLGTSHIVAVAYDVNDRPVSEVHLEGPDGYQFTGDMLAWGAMHLAEHGSEVTGAAGPVEAFGLRTLEAACRGAGLRRTS